jgi:hypothetical protein
MDVFRQYRQYGYWKPFVMRKHGQAAALRHLVPGLFVGVMLLLLALTVIGSVSLAGASHTGDAGGGLATSLRTAMIWLTLLAAAGLGLLAVLYAGAVYAISWHIARRQGRALLRHLPDVIAAYHVGYGLGSLRGWWDAIVRGRPDPAFGRLTRGAAAQR